MRRVGERRQAVREAVRQGLPVRVLPAEIDDEVLDAELGADLEAAAHRGVVDVGAVAPAVEGDVGEALVRVAARRACRRRSGGSGRRVRPGRLRPGR